MTALCGSFVFTPIPTRRPSIDNNSENCIFIEELSRQNLILSWATSSRVPLSLWDLLLNPSRLVIRSYHPLLLRGRKRASPCYRLGTYTNTSWQWSMLLLPEWRLSEMHQQSSTRFSKSRRSPSRIRPCPIRRRNRHQSPDGHL